MNTKPLPLPAAVATAYSLTMISHNRKTGPIPVSSTSRDSCGNCPLAGNGCYGDNHPTAIHWNKLSDGRKGVDIDGFCKQVRMIPTGQLWRHDEVGDLVSISSDPDTLDPVPLHKIIKANKGKRGFTFTHKHQAQNIELLREATAAGFVVNLSANNETEADKLIKTGLPVVMLQPKTAPKVSTTPDGNKIVQCPHSSSKGKMQCNRCQLCYKANRSYIVGFPAHGGQWRKAEALTLKEVL